MFSGTLFFYLTIFNYSLSWYPCAGQYFLVKKPSVSSHAELFWQTNPTKKSSHCSNFILIVSWKLHYIMIMGNVYTIIISHFEKYMAGKLWIPCIRFHGLEKINGMYTIHHRNHVSWLPWLRSILTDTFTTLLVSIMIIFKALYILLILLYITAKILAEYK